jgi:hypothetical protein
MNATKIDPTKRLVFEELEPRAMLSGGPLSDGGALLDPVATGGLSNSSANGILTGAVFSTVGGFSGGGFSAGGGFPTFVGFPSVAFPNGAGFSNNEGFPTGLGFSNGTSFTTGLPLGAGVSLPNGPGFNGVGYPDATIVDEVLALGGDLRFGAVGAEAFGGVFSGGFEKASGFAPDADSGVGQMVTTTGSNTNGATILPTAGFSSRAGGTGGPVKQPAPAEEKDKAPADRKPGEGDAPSNTAPVPREGALDVRVRNVDVAIELFLESAGQA